MRHKPGTTRYEKAQDALEAAMGGDDITNGATLFWGPKSQAALGRPVPRWGRTGGLDIGETRFHRDDGGMVEEREGHAGGKAVGMALLAGRKHILLTTPTPKAPRAFELDYPRGAEANASGRLERSIEGAPLNAPYIAGRQTPGGPDVPLSKQDMEAIMAHITGKPVGYGPLPGNLLDAVTVSKGSGRPTGVTISDKLNEAKQQLVVPHAFGHVVDDSAGKIPFTGVRAQADRTYNTLATGRERDRLFVSPKTQNYPVEEQPRELSAEMIRAYATDPNYLKTVAPDVAARIRDYVNTNPELSKIVQFNAVPAAIGAGAMMQGDGEAPVEREPHAGGKAVGKAGGELIEKGIKAVSDLFKPAATEMSAEAIAAAEKAAAKAAAQAKQLSRVEQHVDAPSQRINDWQWRPTTDVAKDLDLQEIPPHVQAFGDYMRDMVAKANKEGLSDRDLIKAYTTTMSSIQRRAADTDMIREASGLPLIGAEKKIRPEGAWSEWLMSPAGQQYLDRAVKGDLDQNTVDSAFSVMRKFGLAPKQIEAMDWAAKNLPGRSQAASDLVYRAGQQASPVSEWRGFTSDVAGVGPAKSGFLASLLGRGDLPTLDARQVIINTGMPTDASKSIMGRQFRGQKSFGAQEGVDRLAGRQEALGLEAPSQYDPFYQHLTHHSIWDKASNEMTTHSDIINAMRNAAIAVGVPAAGAATMPRGEQQGEPQGEHFAHGGIVERALHLARGGYATPGFVDDQPSEEYSDGARPLTIYRGERPDAAAGPVEVRGDQGPSYDQMGNIVSPGQGADPVVDTAMKVIPPRPNYTENPELLAHQIREYKRQVANIEAMPEHYRQMTHGPSAPRAPIEIEGGLIGKRVVGSAPYDVAGPMSKLYQTAYGLKTAPLYALGSVFPPAAVAATALDTAEAGIDAAHSIREGNYGSAALETALGVVPGVAMARKPLAAAFRGGAGLAREYAPQLLAGSVAGATLAPEDAEAANVRRALQMIAGIGHNQGPSMQTLYSDLSKTKHTIPIEEMNATRIPAYNMESRPTLDPASLQGSKLIGAVGDRTMAGHTLVDINGQPLAYPVKLEGGPDFMRGSAYQNQGAVWASDETPIKSISNFAKKIGEDGRDINLVYSAMGARSGDFSHMMADALLAQMQGRPISKAALDELNTVMSRQNRKWPGIASTDEKDIQQARDIILQNAALRKQFTEEVALANLQNKGFPDIASTRYAISDPAMIGKPTGMSGYSVARLDPNVGYTNTPKVPHTTYPYQLLGGEYRGGLERQVPRHIMFPDFYKERRALGIPIRGDDRSFTFKRLYQDANQEWLDNLMKWVERDRRNMD
jgi:hypothetical protein